MVGRCAELGCKFHQLGDQVVAAVDLLNRDLDARFRQPFDGSEDLFLVLNPLVVIGARRRTGRRRHNAPLGSVFVPTA